MTSAWEGYGTELDRALANEEPSGELTLINVSVYPAVTSGPDESNGLELPVARIPLNAVTLWWIADGTEIKGRRRPNNRWFVGAVVPLPLDL